MHSRRDQVEAHSFMANRLRGALLRAEPDAPHAPLRRTPIGLIIGAVLGIASLLGAALIGLLRPNSNPAWRASGTLIIEKNTGSRFIYISGLLHPVLNYASARLLLGQQMKTASVSAATIGRVARGSEVGTPWAPDSLPPATPAIAHTWLACAAPIITNGVSRPAIELQLESATVPPAPSAAAAAAAVVVRDGEGQSYLIEDGQRWLLAAPWVARSLGIDSRSPLPVRETWLDALPAGPDLNTLTVAGRGGGGPKIDGQTRRVGQLLVNHSPSLPDRHYLVMPGGLVPIGLTAVALAMGDPATAKSYPSSAPREEPISSSGLASATVLGATRNLTDLPPIPQVIQADSAEHVPCLRIDTAGSQFTRSLVTVAINDITAVIPTGLGLTTSALTADLTSVLPGGGMLARSTPVPGVANGALFLVTQDGAKYPVATDDAAAALGYTAADAVGVPPSILAMLPTGPSLRLPGGGA